MDGASLSLRRTSCFPRKQRYDPRLAILQPWHLLEHEKTREQLWVGFSVIESNLEEVAEVS